MKRTLLILVLLSPWLLAVWVGLHNLRQPPRQLQLLTGTTPPLPIGGWLLLSSTLGVTLGATTVGALLQTERSPRRRRLSEARPEETPYGDEADDEGTGEEPDPGTRYWRGAESVMGEPPPIMDVPFRVVRAARTPDPAPDASPPPSSNDADWQPPQSEGW
ncbi:MAG: hypothetical protein F4X84_03600 [Synechococcus sp. SB0662_bin_45]|nr:hypothetical protein [Synechococcus sp. SB0668_bin_13]MYE21457.1 hypothetical protein [Synechococcus sp. SB0662_bin_45]